MIDFCIEDTLILLSSKLLISNRDIWQIGELSHKVNDWDYFCNNAIKNGVAPLIYKTFSLNIDAIKIPENYLLKLEKVYYKSLSRNIIMYEYFRKIISAFNKKKISVIALKGIFLLFCAKDTQNQNSLVIMSKIFC